jgi:catechol 2,3-dioxygenase-like lactoylglutathione lyase family enzyme
MRQEIIHIALVVRDYDEAIDFYVNNKEHLLVIQVVWGNL